MKSTTYRSVNFRVKSIGYERVFLIGKPCRINNLRDPLYRTESLREEGRDKEGNEEGSVEEGVSTAHLRFLSMRASTLIPIAPLTATDFLLAKLTHG